ncbi:MAG TPA: glycosyltransferase family 39 protein [Actinomycetes bacterium]|nr:glycosyltransferase family 39 protein [Actinomycetes bacterium]
MRGGVLDRARAHRASLAILLGLLVAVAVVHAIGMDQAPQRVDDEGTYVAQAWAVQHWHTLAHYTYWYDHPPLGWILMAAWTAATGAFSRASSAVSAGREFMLVVQVASAGLLYVLARRLGLRRPAAAGAVLLFALSPLALSFHRAVYLDNVATPFLLAAFLLVLSPSHRLAAHAAAALAFAAAVLVKETSLLLLPALVWQYWQVNDQRTRRYSLAIAASLFVLLAAAYPLYALLRGELLPGPSHVSLFDAIRFQLADRASGGSPLDPDSVNRHTLGLWLGLDPWLLGAAAVLIPAGLWARRLRPVTAAFTILVLMTLRPGYLPIPLVIAMLPFASLVVAGVADAAARGRSAQAGRVAVPPSRGPSTEAGRAGGLRGRLAGRAVLVAVCLVAAAVVVAPRWWQKDHDLMTVDHDAPFRRAEAWIGDNVPHQGRLLVDDSLWVDLVERGYPPGQVVWFYKLDTDRDVSARYPRGWRDFDYLVSAATLRAFPDRLPQVAEAVRHSRVVASFGHGAERVEIRKVQGSPL